MELISLTIPTAAGETIGVLAEMITAHLAIHPALVIGCGGATEYDESAVELTHIVSGAMVCQISDPLTVRPGAVREFAHWLETVCPLDELSHDVVCKRLPENVRVQIRRFVDAPNHWRPPGYAAACTTSAGAPDRRRCGLAAPPVSPTSAALLRPSVRPEGTEGLGPRGNLAW